jgi:hypothetical protein
LIGTLSEETLGLVVSPNLAFAIWNALKMNMQKTHKNRNSPSDNKLHISVKKMTKPLENISESLKDYVTTLQL